MALLAITQQPAASELRAAYQSTFLMVLGYAGLNPVVYFDVYFNGVYYKTITTTTPWYTVLGVIDVFKADIKDAIQEFLRSAPPFLRILNITNVTDSSAQCYVKVRGSTLNTDGTITQETPIPLQATYNGAPASGGGGLLSNTFSVLNAAIQHEEPVVLSDLLQINTPYSIVFPYKIYPLSRNAAPTSDLTDYGYYAVYIDTNAFLGLPTANVMIRVRIGSSSYFPYGSTTVPITSNTVYYIPTGIRNIRAMSPLASGIPFTVGDIYKVDLVQQAGAFQILMFSTPPITITSCPGKRVFFRNHLGHYEPISFSAGGESNKITSGRWEKPFDLGPTGLFPYPRSGNKSMRGSNRLNVRSNETGSLLGTFPEEQMWLVDQLAGSPDAYLQWRGTYNQQDDLVPINLLDSEVPVLKVDERYGYDVALTYEMSNPNIHTRN